MATSLVATLASQVLLSDRSTFALVELTCNLVIADGRFNAWCAARKRTDDLSEAISEDDWLGHLDRYERIYADLGRALAAYLSSDWPRDAPDIWSQHADTFASRLCTAIAHIDDLGRQWGRSNSCCFDSATRS
jgi:hypothetical protein